MACWPASRAIAARPTRRARSPTPRRISPKTPDRRAAAALLTAARLRNVRPAARTDLAPALFHSAVQEDALRLAGLWKAPTAVEKIGELLEQQQTSLGARRAAIESLRTLGNRSAMTFLDTLTRPEQPPAIRSAALVAIAQVKLDAGIVKAAEVLPALTDEAVALETWRGLLAVKGAPDAFAGKLPKDLPKTPSPPPASAPRAKRARAPRSCSPRSRPSPV